MRYLYCSDYFRQQMNSYDTSIYPYIVLALCFVGSVWSVLSIVVLTRKRMRSPTSTILTSLAVADLSVMVTYMPFATSELLDDELWFGALGHSKHYGWTSYWLFHAVFHKVMHATSIWLTVTLAVWRYLVVCWPHRSQTWCSQRRAKWAVVCVYIGVAVLHTPLYIGNRIDTAVDGETHWAKYGDKIANMGRIGQEEVSLSLVVNLWILGVVVKLIPCVALTMLSLRLVWALVQAKRRRRYLLDNRSCSVRNNSAGGHVVSSDVDRRMDRTTRMVMAVLLFFLVTEFPQGIVALLVAIWGIGFYLECYLYMERTLEGVILLNCAVNFVLYCTMSQEFRLTFKELFLPSSTNSWSQWFSWLRIQRNQVAPEGNNKDNSCTTSSVYVPPDTVVVSAF